MGAIPAPADEPPVLTAEVRRLSDELGWQPKFDLDTGLEQTIAWWKNETGSHTKDTK
ncbi:MAG: hypothetical protein ABIG11_06415 [bacterium]